MLRKCVDCVYCVAKWGEKDGDVKVCECHFNPPVYQESDAGRPVVARYPRIDMDKPGCSKFKEEE